MRIPLPQRFPIQWTTIVAVAFALLQLIQGTNYLFVVLHLAFIMLWAFAFNLTGGFTRVSGAYVFWFGLLTVPVATVTKAVLGEAADTNAWTPTLTMGVYAVSMAVLLLAVLMARMLTGNVVSIAGRLRSYNLDYRNASIGCSILGLSLPFLLNLIDSGQGTLGSAIRQINFFTELGIILGTIAVVEESGHRRSISWLNGVPMFLSFLWGVTIFSKQGMFTSALCWVLAIAYTRYSLRFWGVVALVSYGVFAMTVLAPISQVGRNVDPTADLEGRFLIAVNLLENIGETRQIYTGNADWAIESGGSYYGRDVGMVYRFARFDSDDVLVSFSSKGHYIGYDSFWFAFLNWFPHAILPNKEKYAPAERGGNFYARETGVLSANDRNTAIAYGSPAEAFHFGGWTAVILVQLLMWVLLLISVDLLCGDMRRAPWGLFLAVAYAHVAPEAGVLGTIAFMWTGNVAMFACMAFSTYAAPVIGQLLTSSMRRKDLAAPSFVVAPVNQAQ